MFHRMHSRPTHSEVLIGYWVSCDGCLDALVCDGERPAMGYSGTSLWRSLIRSMASHRRGGEGAA